jgi:hypothetical protein
MLCVLRSRSACELCLLRGSKAPAGTRFLCRTLILCHLTERFRLQGSLIPGSNYSAQDDHAGVQVAGL